MLAADKLLLQSNLKRNATELKEKEFRLHHDNFSAVGTQAAVLAGFAVAALVELDVPAHTSAFLQFCFFVSTIVSLAANLQCVASTTCVSVWGSSLALRGPDGSVLKAVESMFQERRRIFCLFAVGVVAVHSAAMFASMIVMRLEAAVVSTLILAYSLYRLIVYSQKLYTRFHYDESDTVNFDDIFSGIYGSMPSIKKLGKGADKADLEA
mmetsp:Transcript_15632/g.26337  ORF Transcript_15632/g.26337 Transcript_15632/m.26337 type:complete len:210 (+) Transcript_15632:273-902(+)|eukprot:CAMPEP_0198208286 /NCGR_PEP_ID=MMETSP1445-20131203/11668_1 /TAXON_ID=36898 /ORGANISM="Pyramimonas sp., Strain CCMP2087" /LENGTH=209 /DNA_ID=CAMNT_0043881627 /DNA_START=218 /DNA_END=847 /DNA_ORIENTATION=-